MTDHKTIGFIILRHVNNSETNQYWQHCYDSIRRFYPENAVLIVDDNSDYTHITEKDLYKTTIINSEYHKRGELLPYYYYCKNRLFDIAVIIHDSVFINRRMDFSVDQYRILWEFEHWYDVPEDELNMLAIFEDKDIVDFYHDKSLW